MNAARKELSDFYAQQAAREHDEDVFEQGFIEGMQCERRSHMDAYAKGVMHTALVLLGVVVAVAVARAW